MRKKLFNSVQKLFKNYGSTVEIYISDKKSVVKAFVQPVRYQNKMYIDYNRTVMGIKDNSRFVYIGPVEPDITKSVAETTIAYDGRMYTVKRADKVGIDDNVAYIWAILTLRVKDGSYEYI